MLFIVDAGVGSIELDSSNLAEAIREVLRDIGNLMYMDGSKCLCFDLTNILTVKLGNVSSVNPINIRITCNELELISVDVYQL